MGAAASDLIDTFEMSVREELDTFLLPLGAEYESGFSRFKGEPQLLRERGDNIPSIFWFICRYSFERIYIEVGYGGRESLIEAMLGYPLLQLKHHPTILAEAAGRNADGLGGSAWVLDVPFMRKTVRQLTNELKIHWEVFASPSNELFDRAQEILGHRLIFAREEQHRRDRERDTIQASRAFHEGNFKLAVELLTRYQSDKDFTKANQMMLDLARKNLLAFRKE